MSDLISILMPVKNTAPFLYECIESILKQTYKDWELIAVNDSSTDDSLEILNQFQKQDERIKVLQSQGTGVVAALNTAYENCKGNYITRMDSDDINSLNKLDFMLAQLIASGRKNIALGQVKYFAESGVGDGYKKYEQWMNNHIAQGNGFDEIYKECVIPSPCWLLHKDDFESMGGFTNKLYPEDYDLCFRVYKAGIQCIPTCETHLYWRDRPQRTTRIDDNYKADKMLSLKCHYFLDIDYSTDKNLVLWGAGKRGKFIAMYLVENKITFDWVCNNDNKIGVDIYGVILKSENDLGSIPNKQIIVSVSNHEEQAFIKEECDKNSWQAFFFC